MKLALIQKEQELKTGGARTGVVHEDLLKLRQEMDVNFRKEREQLESAIRQKDASLSQAQRQMGDAEAQKKKELEEMNRRFHEEVSILEARFQKQLQEGDRNIVRRIWRALNRTVVIVNFKPTSWFRRTNGSRY